MPSVSHTHTYIRYKSRPGFYRCDAPDCTHFINKEFLINKYSLCTECGAQMILTREDLRRARPRCINCSNTKKAKIHRKTQELTRYLGTESFAPLVANLDFDLGAPAIDLESEEKEELDE